MVIYDGVLVCRSLLPVVSPIVFVPVLFCGRINIKGKHHRQNIDNFKLSVVPRNFEEIIHEYNIIILFRHGAKRDLG